MSIDIAILAAGAATRMGQPKQLLSWRGSTVIGTVLSTAKALRPQALTVVLGAHADAIREELPADTTLCDNADWATGLGSSIALAARRALESSSADALLILLADQPLLAEDQEFLPSMIALHGQNPSDIIAADYEGRYGVPAIFPRSFWPTLALLTGDQGARALLNDGSQVLKSLPIGGLGLDIDTPADYADLKP